MGLTSAAVRYAARRAARDMIGRNALTKVLPSARAVAVPIPRHIWVAPTNTRRQNKFKSTDLKKEYLIAML